jgi:uncharacterized membrane protein YqaE (UPF0057 family)
MKNIMKTKVFAILSAALILGSCGTSNQVVSKGIIVKRKHTKGFFINLPSKNESVLAKKNQEKNEKVTNITTFSVVESPKQVVETGTVSELIQNDVVLTVFNSTPTTIEEVNDVLVSNSPELKVVALKQVAPVVAKKMYEAAQKVPSLKEMKQAKRLAKKSTGRPDQVVLVLLAILIPPLAVYLYEESWTSRCTLNLILTLLCGLPGIIHALIVVLK